MKTLSLALALVMVVPAFSQKKDKPDAFDADGCNYGYLGVKECAKMKKQDEDFQKKLDEDIYPRDIFRVVNDQSGDKPVRGWVLDWKLTEEFDGSVDSVEYLITATKGSEKRYFWVRKESGVEPKTGQSLSSTRVKQLDSPRESPYETTEMRIGLWAVHLEAVYIPGKKTDDGYCVLRPLSGLAEGISPMTQDRCQHGGGWIPQVKDKDGKWINGPLDDYGPMVPWKDLPEEVKRSWADR